MKLKWSIGLAILLGLGIGIGQAMWHFGAFSEDNRDLSIVDVLVGEDDIWDPPPGGPQPKVEVDQVSHDFGAMETGSEDEFTFHFKNVGEFPLGLEKGGSTCKCTVADLKGGVVQPGETVEVTLSWRAIPVGSSTLKHFRQTAVIRTSDPRRETIDLEITGRLTNPVEAEPYQIDFGDVALSEIRTEQVKLFVFRTPLEGESWELSNIEFIDAESRDFFSAKKLRALTGDELKTASAYSGWLAEITITRHEKKSVLLSEPIQQTIRLTANTASDRLPLVMSIRGYIVDDVYVQGAPCKRDQKDLIVDARMTKTGNVKLAWMVYGSKDDVAGLKLEQQQQGVSLTVQPAGPAKKGWRRFEFEIGLPDDFFSAGSGDNSAKREIVILTGRTDLRRLRIQPRQR